MSYLVFARKWRPLTFEDVIGQEHITGTLKRAIQKKRVAHAYIFTGTRGVGKTTTARILARALNCENGPTPQPCNTCEICRAIISGSSFDVLEIDGASNNGVDQIRELRENIHYSSMGGKHRVYVIDEVHMLTRGAFNALLKTLEEPPKNVIFIFATTEPQKIPETIQSRCQRFDFRRIATEQVLKQLETICTREEIPFEKTALHLVARKADGSMRDALSLLDQIYSFCKDQITEKDVRSVLGLVDTDVYNTIIEAMASKTPSVVLQAVEDVLTRGFDLSEFLTGFQEYIRTLLFARLPGVFENQRITMPVDIIRNKTTQASEFTEGDLLRMSELLLKTEYDVKWSSYPRFLVETTLLKLLYMDSTVSIKQLLDSLQQHMPSDDSSDMHSGGLDYNESAVKKKMKILSANSPDTHTVELPVIRSDSEKRVHDKEDAFDPVTENSVSTEDIAARWPLFIEKLTQDRPTLGTFLSLASVAEVTRETIDLRFASNYMFQFSEVAKKSSREIIEKKIKSFYKCPLSLHITIDKHEEKKALDDSKAVYQTVYKHPSLEDDIINEPIIQSVIDMFQGEVI